MEITSITWEDCALIPSWEASGITEVPACAFYVPFKEKDRHRLFLKGLFFKMSLICFHSQRAVQSKPEPCILGFYSTRVKFLKTKQTWEHINCQSNK